MFAMIPAEVAGGTGGQNWRMGSTWSSARLRTLAESVDRIIKTRRRQRSGGYSVYTSVGGGLPDLISFSSKLGKIRDIFSYQVGPDVWRKMIEKETF